MSDPNDGELAAGSRDQVGLVGLGLMGGAMATRLRGGGHTVLGLNRVALAEGLVFARALGVEPAQALEVLRASMAGSRIMDSKGPKMVRGDFTPQARLAQHLKDVRLMLAQADGAGLPMPLSRAHARLLEAAVAAGLGDLDNAAIIQMLGPSLLAPAQAH